MFSLSVACLVDEMAITARKAAMLSERKRTVTLLF